MQNRNTRLGKAIVLVATLLVFPLAGCREHHELDSAAKVARVGNQRATKLADYYGTLAQGAAQLPRTYAFRTQQDPPPPVVADPAKKQEGDYKARQAMAQRLSALYVTMEAIATNKPDDVQAATKKLQSAVEDVNSGHKLAASVGGQPVNATLIGQLLNGVVRDLEDLQKVKNVTRANNDLKNVVQKIEKVYDAEEGVYKQSADGFADERRDWAQYCLDNGIAYPTSAVQPLLDPSGLKVNASPSTEQAKLLYKNLIVKAHSEAVNTSQADADANKELLLQQIKDHDDLAIQLRQP